MEEQIQHLIRGLALEFVGADFEHLERGFCRSLGVKRIEQSRSDLLITSTRVIVAPAKKDHSTLAALGLVFGVGALGAAAAEVLSGLADLRTRGDHISTNADTTLVSEALASCAIWERSNLRFEAFEERTQWDLAGGEWATCARISGACDFEGKKFSAGVEFSFYGRVRNFPLRSKPTAFLPLAEIFDFDLGQIQRRSIWRKRGK